MPALHEHMPPARGTVQLLSCVTCPDPERSTPLFLLLPAQDLLPCLLAYSLVAIHLHVNAEGRDLDLVCSSLFSAHDPWEIVSTQSTGLRRLRV